MVFQIAALQGHARKFTGVILPLKVSGVALAFACLLTHCVRAQATSTSKPAVATVDSVTVFPRDATKGESLTPAPQVTVRDAGSKPLVGTIVTMRVGKYVDSLSDTATGVIGARALTDAAGVATFSSAIITVSPTPRLQVRFTIGALHLDTALVLTQPTATIATPDSIRVVTWFPASVTSGAALPDTPSVYVTSKGKPAAGVTVQLQSSATGVIANGSSVTDASGVAKFSRATLSLSCAATPCVQPTLTFVAGAITVSASQKPVTVRVPVAALAIVPANDTVQAASGAALDDPIQVHATSKDNTDVAGVEIRATVAAAHAMGQVDTTNEGGVATFPNLRVWGAVGAHKVTFTAPSDHVPSATLTLKLRAGATANLHVITQPPPQIIFVDSAFKTQPAVLAEDSTGNALPGVAIIASLVRIRNDTVKQTKDTSDLLGTLIATTDTNGVATFKNLGFTGVSGQYRVRFTLRDVSTGLMPSDTTIVMTYNPDYQFNRSYVVISAIKTIAGLAPPDEFFDVRFRFRLKFQLSVLAAVDLSLSAQGTDSVKSKQQALTEGDLQFNREIVPFKDVTTDVPDRSIYGGLQIKVFETVPYYGFQVGSIELPGSIFSGSNLSLGLVWPFSNQTVYVQSDTIMPGRVNLLLDWFLRSTAVDFFKLLTIRGSVMLPTDRPKQIRARIAIAVPIGSIDLF